MHRILPLTLTLLLLDQENRRLSYPATRKRRNERGARLVRVPSRACALVGAGSSLRGPKPPSGVGVRLRRLARPSGESGRRHGKLCRQRDVPVLARPPPSGWWPRAKAAASPRDRPPAAGPIPPFGRCGQRRGTGGRPSRDRRSVGSLRSRLRPGFGAAGPVALWSICQGAHATWPGGPNPPRVAGSRAGSMRRQGVSSGTPATVSRPSHLAPHSLSPADARHHQVL